MKTMCDLKNQLPENIVFFAEQAMQAKYVCGKCGRIAAEKDLTCKPCKIKKLSGE